MAIDTDPVANDPDSFNAIDSTPGSGDTNTEHDNLDDVSEQ